MINLIMNQYLVLFYITGVMTQILVTTNFFIFYNPDCQ